MEKMTSDEDLLNYLDGFLDQLQVKRLEEEIQHSPELVSRLEELRSVHLSLKASSLFETPSRNFTQRVMTRLDSLPVRNGFSPKNGLLLLAGVLVAVGIGLVLLEAGMFDSLNGTIALDTIPLNRQWLKNPIPSIPFNGKLVINILLIVATGISLVLLDRTVLRPLFARRSEMI